MPMSNPNGATNAAAAAISQLAAAESAAAAVASAGAASDSSTAAASYALTAQGAARVYDTLTAGQTASTTDQYFAVKQVFGKGAYVYKRTASGSQFIEMAPIGAKAQQIAATRALVGTIAPAISGLTTHLWGQNAWEWDNRLVPNEVSGAAAPTLNWLPDPSDPVQENGGGSPTRTINTGATTDPLGGSNALQLDFAAQNVQLAWYVNTEPVVPATDIRVRLFTKTLSGGTAFKLGTTSGLAVTAGAAWDASSLETTITGYTGSSSIGISTAVGNTAASLAIMGAGIFDPLAGESASLPTLAQGLAAQNAGHLKASLARPGAMPLTATGAISLDGANNLTPMIYLDVNHTVLSQYSFGGAFKCDAMPVTTSGNAMSFDNHGVAGGANNTHGQIGVYGATDAVAGRPGRIFMNPAGSVAINQGNAYFPGEGYRTIFVTIDAGNVMLYVDGVPQWLGVVGGWANPAIARMILGAYAATVPRRKTLTPFVGEVNGLFFAKNKVMTQAEVTAQDKHIRARLRLYGQAIAPRKACNIGGGDSLCEFAPSWWWQLGECTQISPRLHGHKEAQGGTRLRTLSAPQTGDWTNADRYAKLVQRIQAADAAGYDKIDFYILPGANDSIDSWITNGYDYHPWKTEFLSYLAGIKAVSPSKVRIVVLTMLPRLGFGDELHLEQQRQAWNDDLRANYVAMGIDRLIDTGLGTERIDISSVVTAEAIAGGTAMGNWREAKAAVPSTRNPAATLTLSALSGASFTGTAPAGTFSTSDMYRVITAGAGGEAKITAFSTAGGTDTVTLSTTGYAPTPWPSEPAAITTRNTITRTPFVALSIASGGWTVKNDSNSTTRLYQTDGLHPGYPGGRMLAELVWPVTKAMQDPLVGLAL